MTLKDSLVEQLNFDDYEPTRMREMPMVEVYIVNSREPPSGIGEPSVPASAVHLVMRSLQRHGSVCDLFRLVSKTLA